MNVREAVECCPHCSAENIFRDHDLQKDGYKVCCHECGREMMLCDECVHAEDNPSGRCDWQECVRDGKAVGTCFRGTTVNAAEEETEEGEGYFSSELRLHVTFDERGRKRLAEAGKTLRVLADVISKSGLESPWADTLREADNVVAQILEHEAY